LNYQRAHPLTHFLSIPAQGEMAAAAAAAASCSHTVAERGGGVILVLGERELIINFSITHEFLQVMMFLL